MKVRYRVLRGRERVNLVILAAYCALIAAMLWGTALAFAPVTPQAAYHQPTGDAQDPSTLQDERDAQSDREQALLPRESASMGFASLAGLLLLFALREVLIAAFSTILLLDICFLLGAPLIALAAARCFFQTFSAGGLYGLLPLAVLAAECLAVYLSYRLAVHHVLDLSNTPIWGG